MQRIDTQTSYNAAMQLLIHEFRTLGERTNAFLIVQSIFIGAFVLLITTSRFPTISQPQIFNIISLVIAFVGIVFCGLHYLSGKTGAEQAFKWRKYMHIEIEKGNIKTPDTNTPWNWLYEKENSKCSTFSLKRLPLPSAWLFYPALFFVVWLGIIIFIICQINLPASVACVITSLLALLVILPVISIVSCCKCPPKEDTN